MMAIAKLFVKNTSLKTTFAGGLTYTYSRKMSWYTFLAIETSTNWYRAKYSSTCFDSPFAIAKVCEFSGLKAQIGLENVLKEMEQIEIIW